MFVANKNNVATKRLLTFTAALLALTVFWSVAWTQTTLAAVSSSQVKSTISAKCEPVLKNYSNKKDEDYKRLKQSCDVLDNKDVSKHQLAGSLLAICQNKSVLSHKSVGKNYYETGGSVNKGDCDKIKTNDDVIKMAKSSGTTGNPSATPADSKGQFLDPAVTEDCQEGGDCDLVKKYVNPGIALLTSVFAILAAISIIVGGIQYSSSSGDPQKSARAKQRITNTIIAIVCYFFLYSFLQFLVPGGIF